MEMQGKKQSPSSSFASLLFGPKDSSSPIFLGNERSNPAAATASGGVSLSLPLPLHLSEPEQKNHCPCMHQARSSKPRVSNNDAQATSSNDFSPYYQEQTSQPFHYSSSIYYGGQDVYSRPQSAQNPGLTTLSKEIGDDDNDAASRGNWWKGSLYY